MPRSPRYCPSGGIFHVLNRANSRSKIFDNVFDYAQFLRIVAEAQSKYPVDVLSYCLMPNHWHFLLRPRTDTALSQFVRWFSNTHTRRYRISNRSWGQGPLYQGRYKSFPVKSDHHCIVVMRYIARNPLRANLVNKAEDWPWSSHGQLAAGENFIKLAEDPFVEPNNWNEFVNTPETPTELEGIRVSIRKGRPYGDSIWVKKTAAELDLNGSLREVGRPRKTLKCD